MIKGLDTAKKAIDKMYQIDPAQWVYVGQCVWINVENEHGNKDQVAEVWVDSRFESQYSTDDVYQANKRGRCEHCNKTIKHHVAIKRNDGDKLYAVGFNCYNETFAHSSTGELSLHRSKKRAERQAREQKWREKAASKRAAFVEQYPELVDAIERARDSNRFMQSMSDALNKRGALTDAQRVAAQRVADQIERERTIEREPIKKYGRQTVTGTIRTLKIQDGYYGPVHKMLVETDQGWRVYCSEPSTLCYYLDNDELREYVHIAPAVGDRIRFDVKLEPSDDDYFAWGKRPTKADYQDDKETRAARKQLSDEIYQVFVNDRDSFKRA